MSEQYVSMVTLLKVTEMPGHPARRGESNRAQSLISQASTPPRLHSDAPAQLPEPSTRAASKRPCVEAL